MQKPSYKISLVLLSILLITAILLSNPFYAVDKNLVLAFNGIRTPTLDVFFLVLTYSAAILTYTIAVISLILSFVIKYKYWKVKLRFAALAVTLSGIMATLIKFSIQRVRPYHLYTAIHNLGPGGGYSFPSGHSCDAFVLAAIVALAYPKKSAVIIIYSWAVLVGLSRVYLGVHYASDVLGGVFTGSSMALLAAYLLSKQKL